ncbi:MAG: helix-turn-helix domain-containing protein [Clostridia bacterium]
MPALPGYYTTAEAAEKLGYNDTSSLRYMCIGGKVPNALKVGKTWFIPESWILSQEKESPKGQGNRGVSRK